MWMVMITCFNVHHAAQLICIIIIGRCVVLMACYRPLYRFCCSCFLSTIGYCTNAKAAVKNFVLTANAGLNSGLSDYGRGHVHDAHDGDAHDGDAHDGDAHRGDCGRVSERASPSMKQECLDRW